MVSWFIHPLTRAELLFGTEEERKDLRNRLGNKYKPTPLDQDYVGPESEEEIDDDREEEENQGESAESGEQESAKNEDDSEEVEPSRKTQNREHRASQNVAKFNDPKRAKWQEEEEEDELLIRELEAKLGIRGKCTIGDGYDGTLWSNIRPTHKTEILYGDEEERALLRTKLGKKYKPTPLDPEWDPKLDQRVDKSTKSEGEEDEADSANEEIGFCEDYREAENDFDGATTPNSGKYVPPALRKAESVSKPELVRRQLKGYINKISDNNLVVHIELIETLYGKFSSYGMQPRK